MSKLPMLFVLSAVAASSSYAETETLPPVLNFYPDCEFKIIDNVSLKRNVRTTGESMNSMLSAGQSLQEKVDRATQKLITRVREQAKEQGANAVILMKKSFPPATTVKSGITYKPVVIEAQLIEDCAPMVAGTKATPLNKDGIKQTGFTIAERKTRKITFEIKPPSKGSKRPDLLNSSVGLDGAFGIELGFTGEQVTEVLGAPSLTMSFGKNQNILSYGRNTWLRFVDNALVEITSNSRWLSRDIVNLIEADERFDQPWQVDGQLQQEAEIESLDKQWVAQNQDNTVFAQQSKQAKLSLYVENYLDNKNLSGVQKLTGFQLQAANTPELSKELLRLAKADSSLSSKWKAFKQGDISTNKEDWFEHSHGIIWLSRSESYHILGQHTIAQVSNGEIDKILFLESTTAIDAPTNWLLDDWYQGQGFEEIEQQLSGNYFALNDSIEISHDNNTVYLEFFEQNDDQRVLFNAKISLY